MCFGQQNRGGQLVNRHFGQTPLAVFALGDPGSSKFPWESVRYSSVVVLLYMNHLLKSRFIAVEKKKVQLSCKVCLRFLHLPLLLPPPSRHLQQHRRLRRQTRGVNPTRSGRLGQRHDLALHQRRRRV